MSWYSAKLLFESVHPDEPASDEQEKLFEESIIIMQADSVDKASESAKEYAIRMQHGYESVSGGWVEWRFIRLLGVFEIMVEEKLADGVEVYARFIFAGSRDTVQGVIERYFPESG